MHTFHEETLNSEDIFEGKVFEVTLDTVRLENGKQARREVVHHGGGAGVVALNEKGEVALVRQFRYAAGKEMVEIPAGKVERGEMPIKTAQRELQEEAGLVAGELVAFGSILPTCAYCTEEIYLFLATRLREGEQKLDEDEFLQVFWLDLDRAVERVFSGEINDAKTVSGLLRAKMLLDAGELKL